MAAALPVAIPLLFAAIRTEPLESSTAQAAFIAPDLRYEDLRSIAPAELPEHSIVLTIEPNDTLDGIFTTGGLSKRDSALLTHAFADHLDLRRLRPGHLVRFHRDRSGNVDAVQMRVTGWGDINALRNENGIFEVTPRQADMRSVTTTISAEIDSSLYDAVRSVGEDAPLMQQLVDVFQWDIDFFSLQKGDTFSVVVEKRYAGNDAVGYGPVLAARFHHAGTTFEAFRHESKDGRAGYYTSDARPLRKQFLRAPLSFTRITSGFSKKRFHPVLKYLRPHYGVDYGAPVGTPVMTTADGVVIEARYKRAEGNFVRIKHTSRIETAYLHMSKFAKGIKKGTKVMQGDVIGYVGSTGLATGPHLDYRVREAGKWIDPLKLRSITPDPLRGAALQKFRQNVAERTSRLSHESEAVADASIRRRALF